MDITPYQAQSELLLDCLAFISWDEGVFALKGGTAINFFIMDMPRFSVDIDLAYLPRTPREKALSGMKDALSSIGHRLNIVY